MPMPKPGSGEKQEDFISRCMGNNHMNSKFSEQDQRAAVCYSQWSNGKKSKLILKKLKRKFKMYNYKSKSAQNVYSDVMYVDERLTDIAERLTYLPSQDLTGLYDHIKIFMSEILLDIQDLSNSQPISQEIGYSDIDIPRERSYANRKQAANFTFMYDMLDIAKSLIIPVVSKLNDGCIFDNSFNNKTTEVAEKISVLFDML